MADVFISYARSDRDKIAALSAALEQAGFSVWWDRHIGAGAAFAEAIEAELESSKAVIVAWSKAALTSNWVKDEASEARDHGKLVPVSIDGTVAPLGFRQFHAIDLSDWTGDPAAPAVVDLLAALEQRVRGLSAAPVAAHRSTGPTSPNAPRRSTAATRSWRPVLLGLGLVVLVAVAFVAYRGFSGRDGTAAGSGTATTAIGSGAAATAFDKSIAVLPFVNRSAKADDAYFTDGMHDDLLAQLSRLRDLRVISRTSVQRYANTNKPISEIARELGVGVILEGGVQRAGNRVRINVQLIDARTDTHLWSQTFDRELTVPNLFDIQSEIPRAIAAQLEAVLDGPGSAGTEKLPTQSTAAYDAYLLGTPLSDYEAGRPDQLRSAAKAFGQATSIDPNFADAYARQALAYLTLVWWRVDLEENLRLARQALERARALAPNALETRLAEGYYRYWGLNDFAGGTEIARVALEQWPQEPRLWQLRAASAQRAGEDGASKSAWEYLITLDPRGSSAFANLAFSYASLGQMAPARQALSRAWALDPKSGYNILVEASIAAILDDADAAWQRYSTLRQQRSQDSMLDVDLAFLWLPELLREPARLQAIADHLAANEVPGLYGLYMQGFQAVALERLGRTSEARAIARDARARMVRLKAGGDDPRGEMRMLSILLSSQSGDAQAARTGIAELLADPPRDQAWIIDSIPVVTGTFARLGDPDAAFDLVEQAMDRWSPAHFAFLKNCVAFDRYREQPRYRQLEARYKAWKSAHPKGD